MNLKKHLEQPWQRVLMLSLAVGIAVVFIQARGPHYHGRQLEHWIEKLDTAGLNQAPVQNNPDHDAAVKAIRTMGARAVPRLRQMLTDKPSDFEYYVSRLLRDIGVDSRSNQRSAELHQKTLVACAVLGADGRDLAPLLIDLLPDPSASSALLRIGPVSVPTLAKHLKSEESWVVKEALFHLRLWGEQSKSATPLLIQLLDHSDAGVRETAAYSLARISPSDATANHLLRVISDPSHEVRLAAAAAIGNLPGGPPKSLRSDLLRIMAKPQDNGRYMALLLMAQIDGDSARSHLSILTESRRHSLTWTEAELVAKLISERAPTLAAELPKTTF